jgi:D-alanyl-D-alanine carboxypeptidase/D-alanyl-D-alanine-endopeptidase (penicillin-binding protein 4)
MAERAVHAMWLANGGTLGGQVREGSVPAGATERLVFESPTLAEVVRDANKFSNNVMAQHLLLALSQGDGPATFARSRQRLQQWWLQRFGPDLPLPEVGNGSGLSRDGRASALALGRLLQQAYAAHAMPDLMASLPASGLDGTLRRSRMGTGLAHLKTGSLRDVQALAGYVHRPDGQRLVLVAVVNHPNAHAARPALDALVQWAASTELTVNR